MARKRAELTPMGWQAAELPDWSREAARSGRLDPYFVIALASNFDDHAPRDADTGRWSVVLEIDPDASEACAELSALAAQGEELSTAGLAARSAFISARLPLAVVASLLSHPWLRQVALTEPLRAQRVARRTPAPPAAAPEAFPLAGNTKGPAEGERVLLAIVDHGCPFAHRAFRRAGTDGGTRVLAIWDQDPSPDGPSTLGPPAGHGYGRQIDRATLDACMAASRGPAGLDEDLCYRLAGCTALGAGLTHGSHSMGMLAGSVGAYGQQVHDRASNADIVFVQLPRDVLQAPSGVAIHRCLLDALRYIDDGAAANGFDRVVVSIGYGSYLGPHDGSSLFERALDEFLARSRRPFHCVLAAGNGFDAQVHGEARLSAHQGAEFDWHMPTGNETPVHAEIWVQADDADGTALSLSVCGDLLAMTQPGCQVWPDALEPALVVVRQPACDGQCVVTVRVAPTLREDGHRAAAPAGDYRLALRSAAGQSANFDVYVAWGGENLGFPVRSIQTRLAAVGSGAATVTGAGTLTGSGCGLSPRLFVAGGFVPAPGAAGTPRKASYSAAGPTRRGGRPGPSLLAQSEEDAREFGLPGPGTRGMAPGYLSGTSVAAPQLARQLANEGTARVRPAPATASAAAHGAGFLLPATSAPAGSR